MQHLFRKSLIFQNLPQPPQSVDLNLSHPLAGDADFATDLLQRGTLMAIEAEPPASNVILRLSRSNPLIYSFTAACPLALPLLVTVAITCTGTPGEVLLADR